MFFNSIDFAIFLPIVFILYWFATNKNLKLQNFLIVVASYTFYGWWDWRFLSLIFFSTIVDYTIGRNLKLEKNKIRDRKNAKALHDLGWQVLIIWECQTGDDAIMERIVNNKLC